MNRVVLINDTEPGPLSWRQPLGVDVNLSVQFVAQDNSPVAATDLAPQLILFPRSLGGIYGYDLDPAGASDSASVQIPGTAMVDRAGYNVELYRRDPANGKPISLLAQGSIAIQGNAYMQLGPLGMISAPTGPMGPAGPQGQPGGQGEQGVRGSIWFTDMGPPSSIPAALPNDMYLDTNSGAVWQFAGDPPVWVQQ
jgi:hypothetical protein